MTDGFDTQTDFRNPVVEALGLDQTTVKAGDHFFLSYDVSDFTHKRNTDGKLLFGDPDPSLRDADGNYTELSTLERLHSMPMKTKFMVIRSRYFG